jgi:uncharacterized protein with FMN-binding domain
MTLFSCKPAPLTVADIQLPNIVNGVYTGQSKNINEAMVRVTIENGRIVSVEIEKLDATPFGQKAKDSIPQRIVRHQTPYVDAVTGATEASNTLINAVVNAITKEPSKVY